MVLHFAMSQTQSAACFRQEVGCVRHAFHSAGDHDAVRADGDEIGREHRRLHAGTADFVDRRAADRIRKARAESSLTRRRLSLTRGQDVAHDDFVDVLRRNAGPLHCRANRRRPELVRRQVFQRALKAADGRADG